MAAILLLACLPNLGGCSSSAGSDEVRHYGPRVNIANFIGNTAAYKEKAITLLLRVDEPCDRDKGQSLRDRTVRFRVIGSGGERLTLAIFIPMGLDVPDVGYADEVSVRFLCKRGSLSQGNEALSIEAP